jgi:hypothetical protein
LTHGSSPATADLQGFQAGFELTRGSAVAYAETQLRVSLRFLSLLPLAWRGDVTRVEREK